MRGNPCKEPGQPSLQLHARRERDVHRPVLESRQRRHTVAPSAGPSFETPGHRDSRANTRAHQIRFQCGWRNQLCNHWIVQSLELGNMLSQSMAGRQQAASLLDTAGALNSCVDFGLPHVKAQCVTWTQAACAEVCVCSEGAAYQGLAPPGVEQQ